MQKIFIMYRLYDGIGMENHKAWSREIGQHITPGQPRRICFEVYANEGAENIEPFV